MINFKVDETKCIKCGKCAETCPFGVIVIEDDLPYIPEENERYCIRCQHCLAVCPTEAISILNKDAKNSINIENASYPDHKELELLFKGRRSIRKYKNENIEKENIHYLLETALYAPTGVNVNKVNFSVVEDKEKMYELKKQVYDKLQELIDNDKLSNQFEMFKTVVQRWQENSVDIMFRNAPHMLIASTPKDCPTPQEDTIIALSYFEIMAVAMGYGTLWCGMGKWAIDNIAPELRKVFGIPENHIIGNILLFGKPDVEFKRTVQQEQKDNIKIV